MGAGAHVFPNPAPVEQSDLIGFLGRILEPAIGKNQCRRIQFVGLCVTRPEDVTHRNVPRHQCIGEQLSMTFPMYRFCTHHGRRLATGESDEFRECSVECGGSRVICVSPESVRRPVGVR